MKSEKEVKAYDEYQVKWLRQKGYFDAGRGMTDFFKYFVGAYALSSLNIETTIGIVIGYGIFCYFFGIFLYKYGWIDAQTEVANRQNQFVKQWRNKEKFK